MEDFLQAALFASVDLRSRRASPFDRRLLVALNGLLTQLKAATDVFRCWVPVEGLKIDRPSARFGGVAFVKFGRHQLREMTRRRPPEARGANWQPFRKILRDSNAWGSVCAVVDVDARDYESAQTVAIARTRQILDVVNVFSDLVPYNYGWLYLPGDAARSRQVIPIQRRNGDATALHTRLEPFTALSWKSLTDARGIARPLRGLDRLARSVKGDDTCAALLLTAAQWIGRATVDRRREQSFLLYAIALETMLLPDQSTELGFRLRLRAAHVLEKGVARRERISKDMARLYDVRSKIVHAGSYQVTDEDLGRLRFLVKRALFRLVSVPKIHPMKRDKFAAWLDRRLFH